MAKANFKCECGKTKIVNFKPGEVLSEVKCECGKLMTRQFGQVNIGYIIEDDLLSTGMMMSYNSSTVVR